MIIRFRIATDDWGFWWHDYGNAKRYSIFDIHFVDDVHSRGIEIMI